MPHPSNSMYYGTVLHRFMDFCSRSVLVHASIMIICLKTGLRPNLFSPFCCLSSLCTPAVDSVAVAGQSCKSQTTKDVWSKHPYRMKQISCGENHRFLLWLRASGRLLFTFLGADIDWGQSNLLVPQCLLVLAKRDKHLLVGVQQQAKLSHEDACTSPPCMKIWCPIASIHASPWEHRCKTERDI